MTTNIEYGQHQQSINYFMLSAVSRRFFATAGKKQIAVLYLLFLLIDCVAFRDAVSMMVVRFMKLYL